MRYSIIIIILILSGCTKIEDDPLRYPGEKYKGPFLIEAIGEEGVILSTPEGNLFFYSEYYNITQAINKSELKVGDIIGKGFILNENKVN